MKLVLWFISSLTVLIAASNQQGHVLRTTNYGCNTTYQLPETGDDALLAFWINYDLTRLEFQLQLADHKSLTNRSLSYDRTNEWQFIEITNENIFIPPQTLIDLTMYQHPLKGSVIVSSHQLLHWQMCPSKYRCGLPDPEAKNQPILTVVCCLLAITSIFLIAYIIHIKKTYQAQLKDALLTATNKLQIQVSQEHIYEEMKPSTIPPQVLRRQSSHGSENSLYGVVLH